MLSQCVSTDFSLYVIFFMHGNSSSNRCRQFVVFQMKLRWAKGFWRKWVGERERLSDWKKMGAKNMWKCQSKVIGKVSSFIQVIYLCSLHTLLYWTFYRWTWVSGLANSALYCPSLYSTHASFQDRSVLFICCLTTFKHVSFSSSWIQTKEWSM